MTRRRHFFLVIVVIVAVTVLISRVIDSARATIPPLIDFTNVTLEESYVLNGVHQGDLVVAANDVLLSAGAVVDGDIALVAGSVNLGGVVDGDVSIAAENVLIDAAQISGDVAILASTVLINGDIAGDLSVTAENLNLANGLRVTGTLQACADALVDARADAVKPECSGENTVEPLASLIALRAGEAITIQAPSAAFVVFTGLGFSLFMAALASLAVTIFPQHFSRIEEAIRAMPRRLTGIGGAILLLSLGITIAQIIALAILPPVGILLIPIYLFALLLLLALMTIGWVTLSLVLGVWVTRRLSGTPRYATRRPVPPLVAVIVGSLIVSLSLTLIALLPFGGVIVALLLIGLMSIGVGAALLTRFGTRTLRRSTFVQG
jgi:cytoskeletal protein CcmA (bactofilin family)